MVDFEAYKQILEKVEFPEGLQQNVQEVLEDKTMSDELKYGKLVELTGVF